MAGIVRAALAAGVFSIVDSKTVRAQGGVETVGADSLDKAEQWFYTHSAGAAPYLLRRYARETEIVLERNDGYYGPKPFFREVIVRHIKDPSTQSLTLQRGDVAIEEVRATRADTGEEVYIRAASAPIFQDGRIIGAVAINTDITAQKRIERALRDKEEMLRLILASVEDRLCQQESRRD